MRPAITAQQIADYMGWSLHDHTYHASGQLDAWFYVKPDGPFVDLTLSVAPPTPGATEPQHHYTLRSAWLEEIDERRACGPGDLLRYIGQSWRQRLLDTEKVLAPALKAIGMAKCWRCASKEDET